MPSPTPRAGDPNVFRAIIAVGALVLIAALVFVYYRVSQIDDWVRRREAASPRSGDDATFESVVRQAKKLADRAPSLSAQQQAVIETVLAIPAEAES